MKRSRQGRRTRQIHLGFPEMNLHSNTYCRWLLCINLFLSTCQTSVSFFIIPLVPQFNIIRLSVLPHTSALFSVLLSDSDVSRLISSPMYFFSSRKAVGEEGKEERRRRQKGEKASTIKEWVRMKRSCHFLHSLANDLTQPNVNLCDLCNMELK